MSLLVKITVLRPGWTENTQTYAYVCMFHSWYCQHKGSQHTAVFDADEDI